MLSSNYTIQADEEAKASEVLVEQPKRPFFTVKGCLYWILQTEVFLNLCLAAIMTIVSISRNFFYSAGCKHLGSKSFIDLSFASYPGFNVCVGLALPIICMSLLSVYLACRYYQKKDFCELKENLKGLICLAILKKVYHLVIAKWAAIEIAKTTVWLSYYVVIGDEACEITKAGFAYVGLVIVLWILLAQFLSDFVQMVLSCKLFRKQKSEA